MLHFLSRSRPVGGIVLNFEYKPLKNGYKRCIAAWGSLSIPLLFFGLACDGLKQHIYTNQAFCLRTEEL